MSERTRTPLRGIPTRRAMTSDPRPRRVSEEHGWNRFEQALIELVEGTKEDVRQVSEAVGQLAVRLTVIEDHRLKEEGAEAVQKKIWGWVLGIVAVLVTAGIIALARGLH